MERRDQFLGNDTHHYHHITIFNRQYSLFSLFVLVLHAPNKALWWRNKGMILFSVKKTKNKNKIVFGKFMHTGGRDDDGRNIPQWLFLVTM